VSSTVSFRRSTNTEIVEAALYKAIALMAHRIERQMTRPCAHSVHQILHLGDREIVGLGPSRTRGRLEERRPTKGTRITMPL
jgi:hypothetical protein